MELGLLDTQCAVGAPVLADPAGLSKLLRNLRYSG